METRGAGSAQRADARTCAPRALRVANRAEWCEDCETVHTPDAPYATPTDGMHYSPTTGAWLAWRTHRAHDGACALGEGTVLIVRESGLPLLGERVPRDAARMTDTAVVRDVAPRSVRSYVWDPWDGTRATRALTTRYAATDARVRGDNAYRRALASDAEYHPHACPTTREPRERGERVPPVGVNVPTPLCTRSHATDALRRACDASNARIIAARDAERRARRRALRERAVAWDTRADAPYGCIL